MEADDLCVAGLKTSVYDCHHFNEISVQELRDSPITQGEDCSKVGIPSGQYINGDRML